MRTRTHYECDAHCAVCPGMVCAEIDSQHTYLDVFYGEKVVCTANHHNQVLARLFVYLKAYWSRGGGGQRRAAVA